VNLKYADAALSVLGPKLPQIFKTDDEVSGYPDVPDEPFNPLALRRRAGNRRRGRPRRLDRIPAQPERLVLDRHRVPRRGRGAARDRPERRGT